ncbi:hypothetical protein [Algoriphagus litoralis]|uniref:hypothetical protein n=1 Tax=Algoriphagus litoralis TaxID=2202829 RepID=UPI000DBA7C31|nr:hypothetical protein [Algoriphagus litoralis]
MSPYEILSAEAYNNPLGEITRLFTEVMDLPGWRAELRKLENGLHRTKETWMGQNSKDHDRIMRELERMLAAARKISDYHVDFYKIKKVKVKNLVPPAVGVEDSKYNYTALPIFLRSKALVNPVLELYFIYETNCFENWIHLIRQWSSISLSELNIDDQTALSFVPELYDRTEFITLYQLVELCHLLFVRYFKYSPESLEKWEGKNWDKIWTASFSHIKFLFSYFDIKFFRELLETIRSGYYDKNPVWFGKNPSDFIRNVEYLKQLVTHSEVLTNYYSDDQADVFLEVQLFHVVNQDVANKIGAYHPDLPKQFPIYLNEEEIHSPLFFLESFFKESSKTEWCSFLDQCLLECMDHFSSMEHHFSIKTQSKVNELIKMVEACHLILLRLDPDKKAENLTANPKSQTNEH